MAEQKPKYYAVHNGREGTQIYTTWAEAKPNVTDDEHVRCKGFFSLDAAQGWLEGLKDAYPAHFPPPHQYANQPVQQQMQQRVPRMGNGYDDSMHVDNEDSDVEILAGPPPSARPQPVKYEEDSDIEILDGPPPDWGTPSRVQSHTPRRQQQPQAGPSRHAPTPHRAAPYAVKREPRRSSEGGTPHRAQPRTPNWQQQAQAGPSRNATPRRASPNGNGVKTEPERSSGWSTPSRPQSRIPSWQQQPQAGPSRQVSPRQVASAAVKQEPSPPQQEPVLGNGGHIGDADVPMVPAGMLATGPVREVQLSPDQLYVFAKVKHGDSVFFTGSAGTGKSVLLREIKEHFGGRPSNRLGVTASTGIASINIGGCTLHSWAGIGLGKDDKYGLVARILGMAKKAYIEYEEKCTELWAKKARGEQLTWEEQEFLDTDPAKTRKNKALDRWRQCRVLIIDEISMIDGKLFDKLEFVGRKLRKNELPFGGIQLVLSGDFCQLPPVPDKSATGGQIPACFAFDSESWNRCVGPPNVLRKVFRQKDQAFVEMLNAMRFGNLDEKTTRAFHQLSREVKYDDGIEPTELFPKKDEVESANSRRLKALSGEPRNYRALDAPGRDDYGREYPPDRVERALKDVIAPKTLPLKIGAQVMLLQNIIQGLLVNGSMGRVVAFYRTREAHDKGIQIAIPGPDKPQEEAQAEQKLKSLLASSDVYPCVQFHSGPLMLCVRLSFEVVNAEGKIEAVREQVPLMLAWALSIHKSQGQTLERVRVDLANIFEKGQAYVALSRATRMETLQVLNFDSSKVRAHPRVLEWMTEHTPNMPEPPYLPRDDSEEELE